MEKSKILSLIALFFVLTTGFFGVSWINEKDRADRCGDALNNLFLEKRNVEKESANRYGELLDCESAIKRDYIKVEDYIGYCRGYCHLIVPVGGEPVFDEWQSEYDDEVVSAVIWDLETDSIITEKDLWFDDPNAEWGYWFACESPEKVKAMR